MWRRAALGAATLLSALLMPSVAFAHATLVRSDPPDACLTPKTSRPVDSAASCSDAVVLDASPTLVRLRFSEPVQSVAGGITVRGPDGKPVQQGAVRADTTTLEVDVAAATTGTYQVVWRVVSADTHPARGAFAFSVGAPSPGLGSGPGPSDSGDVSSLGLGLQVLARWLHLLGYALAFGILACRALGWPASTPSRLLERLVTLGIVVLLLAEPLALLAQSASLGADATFDPNALSDILASSFGRVFALRWAAVVFLWVVVGAASYATVWAPRCAALLGLGLAVVDGQAAHAATARPAWLALSANAVHEAAMGLWLGGLVVLVCLWRVGSDRRTDTAGMGRLAVAAFAVLTLSGATLAAEHLKSAADLVGTPYGRALLAKLAVLSLAVLLGVAATRGARRYARRLRVAEGAVLTVVVGLAGLLVSLPPPV